MEWLSGRIMLLSGAGRAFVAFLAGLFTVLALPPFGIFIVPFLTFPVLVWLMDGASGNPDHGLLRRAFPAFAIGWCFGFGYFLGGLWWLGNALLVEADDFAWALPLAVIGLPAVLAVYYGLATVLARMLWSDGLGRIAALALAFGVAEWVRGFLLTGFPWNAIGYAAMPAPVMMQSAVVFGLSGMNGLAVFVFAMPALIGTRKGAGLGLSLAALLVIAHVGYGYWRLSAPAVPEAGLSVRLVQPVIDQSTKLDDAAREEIFTAHLQLTAAAPAEGGKRPDIVVWPETSVPFLLTENPDALVSIADVLQDGQVLIAGAVRGENAGTGLPPRYYNSVYAIDDRGQIIGAADKLHLVPFGEYLPFESLLSSLGLQSVAASMPGGFSAAASRSLLTLPDGKVLYPLICYEAIFPDEIGDDALRTDMLLNVTNDAWFGDTPGPYQHFQQARLRAVETGVPLVRGANSGISAVVDGYGEVVSGAAFDVKGVVDTILPGKVAIPFTPGEQQRNALLIAVMSLAVALVSRTSFVFRVN